MNWQWVHTPNRRSLLLVIYFSITYTICCFAFGSHISLAIFETMHFCLRDAAGLRPHRILLYSIWHTRNCIMNFDDTKKEKRIYVQCYTFANWKFVWNYWPFECEDMHFGTMECMDFEATQFYLFGVCIFRKRLNELKFCKLFVTQHKYALYFCNNQIVVFPYLNCMNVRHKSPVRSSFFFLFILLCFAQWSMTLPRACQT